MARSASLRSKFSAGVVPVRIGDGAPRFLVLRAYRLWDFPKGEPESGEEPLATALRELREETGLDNAELCWGTQFCETTPYSRGKVARYYVARCERGEACLPTNPELGHPEHHEFRWVDPEEAATLLPPRLAGVLRWALQRVAAAGSAS